MAAPPPSFPPALLAPPDPARLPLPPAASPEPGVRLLRGAVYSVPEGIRPLELDLWLPERVPGPVPVVVFVHGGGWRMGLRDDLGPRFRTWSPGPFARLVRAGCAVACPDYRLTGEATHPAQLDDVSAALGWLHTRSAELGLDTGRTVVWGESAGGHLAALAALTAGERRGSATVRGCAVWYAPADLTALAADYPEGRYDPADPGTFEARLIGAALADAPERARAASPVGRVTAGAPPFLVLHGTDDVIVPCVQSERLVTALREAGAEAELHRVEGGDHLWVGLSDDAVEHCFTTTLDFVARCTS
ncbi:alpha/beta hydrolase fold domain-containing protein [Streptomyces sp. NPDC059785]|uniref:alpha/beta hydrolase fold domain-containing protein n=1 Tax=unclassified Streptomyces TaxID=2593676 RepID=UPI00365EDF3E